MLVPLLYIVCLCTNQSYYVASYAALISDSLLMLILYEINHEIIWNRCYYSSDW